MPEAPFELFACTKGRAFVGDSAVLMQSELEPESVNLVVTSPPFALLRQKDYGNEEASNYLQWFRQFAEGFQRVLRQDGSLVIDIGGVWNRGYPTRNLYHFELLIMLCKEYGFHLAQEFYWWNPSKLPTPAEWVTVRRVRVKDAVNCIWWLSPTPFPKASNRRVLQPYSNSMRNLLANGYSRRKRPSGHDISDKFQKDNKGAIPPNLLAAANTESNSAYQRYCRDRGLPEHPARFPASIPSFFIRMLTDPDDLVLDPFAGSCVTGEVAERAGRQWICCDLEEAYVEGARGRFTDLQAEIFAGRSKKTRLSYAIHHPTQVIIDESQAPLARDGGKSRKPRLSDRGENDGPGDEARHS